MEMFDNGQSPDNKNDRLDNNMTDGSENAGGAVQPEPQTASGEYAVPDEQQVAPNEYAAPAEQLTNPDVNRDGGIFAEKDYSTSTEAAAYQKVQPFQPQNMPYGQGYHPADNAYRQMYSGGAPDYRAQYSQAQNMNDPRVGYNGRQQTYPQNYGQNAQQSYYRTGAFEGEPAGGNVPPQNGYAQPQGYEQYSRVNTPSSGYYYQPQVGAVPADAPAEEMKGSSKGWIIAVIIIVVLMFAAVMLLLAFGHKDEGKDAALEAPSQTVSASEENVTVNINVAPKPVLDESLYQNKETGLLTPAGAASQVLPSIVNLYGYKSSTLQPYNEASGIIISEDGYIITNAHATEDITRFKAKLNDDREFEAKFIGSDPRTDLAVLKIEADGLTPAVIGSSSDMKQGEGVIAIGNAGGFNNTVTVGNVSYVDREIKSYTGYPIKCIQTDAALNFGNSGGALVNLYGQVIGVVVSKYSYTGSENIGFAISSDFAVPVVEDIMEKGYVTGRGRIGIIYRFISPENADSLGVKPGLLISEIDGECDIAKTELRADDIITEIDGITMMTENSIKEFQTTHEAGEIVTAKVYRKEFEGGVKEFEISFRLEEDK